MAAFKQAKSTDIPEKPETEQLGKVLCYIPLVKFYFQFAFLTINFYSTSTCFYLLPT